MKTFPIPDAIADKYKGSGHALAAVTGGKIVGLVHIRDALPDYEDGSIASLALAINDQRLAPAVRELRALGEMHVGMCSCWEFCVL